MSQPLVTEYAGPQNLRKLSAAIVVQAIKDMKHRNPKRALDALAWITDPRSDFALYMETANMGNADIFNLLISSDARTRTSKTRKGQGIA